MENTLSFLDTLAPNKHIILEVTSRYGVDTMLPSTIMSVLEDNIGDTSINDEMYCELTPPSMCIVPPLFGPFRVTGGSPLLEVQVTPA